MLRWFRGTTNAKPTGTTLPQPTGPYSVGFTDYEWIPSASKHTDKPPAHVLARIYYPSLPVTHHEGGDALAPEWRTRSHWIPSPAYYPGYGYYMRMPWYIASPLFRLAAGNTPIWAVEGAPVVPEERLANIPLVIFSHGLAGIRTTYSTICTEIASHGYIVAAIEHRDGSASMSLCPRDESVLQYQHPPADDREAWTFRSGQLRHRRQEVSATLDLLLSRTEGLAENLWRQKSGHEPSTRNDLIDEPLSFLRERISCTNVVMAGHSFGAATSILSSQEDDRIQAVLGFDPWMFALPDDFTLAKQHRGIPLISIHSSVFHWPSNTTAIRAVLERNHQLAPEAPTLQITISETRHMDQSDFTVMTPTWLAGRFRAAPLSDPVESLRVNTQLALSFVNGLHQRPLDLIEQYRRLIWDKEAKDEEYPRLSIDIKL